MQISYFLAGWPNAGGSEHGSYRLFIAERFGGSGPWKQRLPQLLETPVALGRARQSDDGRFGGSK